MSVPPLSYDVLRQSVDATVCIIGAGIAGITTAYLLAKEGVSVVVLNDGPIGNGETGRTTAHLSYILRRRYHELVQLHGMRGARMVVESHASALAAIEGIILAEEIECDYARVDGYLFSSDESSRESLREEVATLHDLGYTRAELLSRPPIHTLSGTTVLRVPGQGQFHPLKYLHALAHAAVKAGARFYTESRVLEVTTSGAHHAVTEEGSVTAQHFVVATNTPATERFHLHSKQAAYRTYVIGVEIPQGSFPLSLFWDTADPYHYVRLIPGDFEEEFDLAIIGGEDHRTGQDDPSHDPYEALETWAHDRLDLHGEVVARWSGQVQESVDGVGYIGKDPSQEGRYFITGDSGNGMTNGTIGGIVLTDLIRGRENPWVELYDPSRVSIGAALPFFKENLNSLGQYRSWVIDGEVKDPSEIPPGSGGVIRRGFRKIAVYRDDDGAVHECSATCPHLGGIVRWNHQEKSWDCPCHGSRFTPYGEVINGPAMTPLATVEDAEISPEEARLAALESEHKRI